MLSVRQIVNKPIMEAVRQGKISQFAQKAMMSYCIECSSNILTDIPISVSQSVNSAVVIERTDTFGVVKFTVHTITV